MNRRSFLAGSLMLPWLLGCQPGRPLRGSVVGANHALGHRLREARRLPNLGQRRSCKVAIVGGGIAGLCAAWRLRQAGVDDFLLLELESDLGGNSRAAHYASGPAPWAAHYLPVPTGESRVVQRLLREMEILLSFGPQGQPVYAEEFLCHAPEERVFVKGRWEEGLFPRSLASAEDLRQWRRWEQEMQRWQNWRDRQGRKAFALPLSYSSRAPEVLALDRISLADYLSQLGLTSPLLRWWVEYACRDDYGTSLQHTSAWAGIHYFASRDGGGFQPRDTQFCWPEGNQRLVRHLATGLQQRYLTQRLVVGLSRVGSQWQVDCWNEEQSRWEGLLAEKVIVATPTFLRSHLLGEAPRPEFSYAPWTVCNLLLDRLPESALLGGTPLSWDNVIYDSPGLGYVVANHQVASHQFGPCCWTYYRPWSELDPLQARRQLLQAPWQQTCSQVLADLTRAHPDLPERCEQLDIMHLGHAMIRPLPGLLSGPALPAAARAREGLYFGHSDLSGISLFEEASYQGVRAAQELLADWGSLKEDFLET